MSEVEPRLKPDAYGMCGCGCGREGRFRKKAWAVLKDDGSPLRCVVNCDKAQCRRCRGSASNSSGRRKQTTIRQRSHATGRYHGAGHEENWQGPWRSEAKSGSRDAQVVATAYERERAQSDQAKSIGDTRPFVPGYAPKGTRRSYHIIRDDELELACVSYCEAVGYKVEAPGEVA